jgi:hypothetical protein
MGSSFRRPLRLASSTLGKIMIFKRKPQFILDEKAADRRRNKAE